MRITEPRPELSLLPPGSHVLCAVSGGADSVCLLSLLRERGEYRLSCAHFNHCLRGEESERDEAFVRSLCAEWGVPFYAGRADVRALAEREHLSVETAAREARYAFLQKTAEEIGAELIATAHTADDQAETILFRLCRGTSLRGLGGIPERRGNIVRPLLRVTRQEIEGYLTERGIPHVEDSSNAEDEAARNRLRHHAVPVLKSVNEGFTGNVGRMAARAREDEEYLSAMAEEAWSRVRDGDGLSLSALNALPKALSRRVLDKAAGRRLSLEEGDAVLSLLHSASPAAKLSLSSLKAERSYDRLRFSAETGEPGELVPRVVTPGEDTVLEEAGLTLRAEILPPGSDVQSSFNTFTFCCGMICGTLSVTARREGDAIRFAHRQGSRSLHRLMIDGKIPRRERGLIPVLRDEAGVLAVYGFGQAERALGRGDEPCVRITIRKNTDKAEEQTK